MPGDDFLEPGPTIRVAMTRAVTVAAPPAEVWPWIAQLGRGAGWYSVDRLDNGGKGSARHLVSWIPEPQLGDATAIGYLRHLEVGKVMAWWVDGVAFAGATARLVCSYQLEARSSGSRLVSRMSADATGLMAPFALLVFRVIDSIMAVRQLQGIRDRAESSPEVQDRSRAMEGGDRDQFQLYEVLYRSGRRAGSAGKEHAARWRRAAIADGVVDAASDT
jgi:hypothetical protein